MFNNIYKNKKVFITGHTGFKGSWLCLWLNRLGAHITGYALNPEIQPNHFENINFNHLESYFNDIRNCEELSQAIQKSKPDIVFHLAAQPLVRYSYQHPHETFETNVMGTINLFEACRKFPGIKAIINITSDKCYENNEWVWGYRENEPMGGHDPYSCSKGCAELVTASYRKSFFSETVSGEPDILLASVRAGNVIGGGDWAEDRIIPDIVKAAIEDKAVKIRNPNAVRPWQHVLEPLSGYLLLGQKLLEEKKEFADAWNFGPDDSDVMSVRELAITIKKYWNSVRFDIAAPAQKFQEAGLLKLDSSKARFFLKWNPVWDKENAVKQTIEWYKAFCERKEVISLNQIEGYIKAAESVVRMNENN